MFARPGILVLTVFLIGRPFDLFPVLQGLPLLYLFCGLALFGFALDLQLRFTELRVVQQVVWASLFIAWCIATVVLKGRHELVKLITELAIVYIFYVLVAQGIRSFRALEEMAKLLVACGLFICVLCVHLGFQPKQCVGYLPHETPLGDLGHPDGRACNISSDCRGGSLDNYSCEHAGLFGMTSVGRRIRFVGTLQDPNEVALFCSAVLPFIFAFYQRRPGKRMLLFALLSTALIVECVLMSKSRGGMLVAATVLGYYAIQRFGLVRVLKVGVPLALPVFLWTLSIPERPDAQLSTMKRLGCLDAGLDMFRKWPLVGVGFGQYTQHHEQTAHNSYVLALAETGPVGLFLWVTTYYVSVKTTIIALRRCKGEESKVARIWGQALRTSLVGLSVGVFFLSFTYHYVLWVFFGLAGAFSAAVHAHVPGWRVPMRWRDFVLIVIMCVTLPVSLAVYLAFKL